MRASLSRHSPFPAPGLLGAVQPFPGRAWRLLGGAALTTLLLSLAAGCGQAPPPAKKKTVVVSVARPTVDRHTDFEEVTGRLEAAHMVEIRPRVSGYLTEAIDSKQEGQPVRKGQVLFQVQPKPFKVDLALAEANVKLAEAERNLQEKIVERNRRLVPTGAVRQEEYEQSVAAYEKAIASVDAYRQSVEKARIQLGYTDVISPINGIVSHRKIDPGSVVIADNTLLTTVVSEDPMYVYFDVDERTFLDLVNKARGASAEAAHLRDMKFPVWFRLANEDDKAGFPHQGKINFMDNRVNAGTGTMRFRCEFDNKADEYGKRPLKVGLFARIRIPITPPYQAILVPDEAILSDQGKKYVYVVKDVHEEEVENARHELVKAQFGTVEYRSVMLGQPFSKDLRVIKEGVKPEDQIIVTNMQQVRPGLKVQLAAPKKPAGAE